MMIHFHSLLTYFANYVTKLSHCIFAFKLDFRHARARMLLAYKIQLPNVAYISLICITKPGYL